MKGFSDPDRRLLLCQRVCQDSDFLVKEQEKNTQTEFSHNPADDDLSVKCVFILLFSVRYL